MTGGSITAKEQAIKTTFRGHIIATDVTLKTKDIYGIGVACEDLSIVELLGKTTINNAFIGIQVIDEATIKMTGGTITASAAGATFLNSHSYQYENKLENVTISSIKKDVPLFFGIKADASYISLNNVTVTQAQTAIEAYDSIMNVLGGSFDAERTAIFAQNGSTIALTGDANITSDNVGLYAAGSNSTIEMTGGSITAKEQAVKTTSGGHITVTDVTLKTKDGYGTGVVSSDLGSMIELLGKTTINDTFFGLQAQNGGAIKMTGGTITTTSTSAIFSNSNSSENKLENVTISGVEKDGALYYAINTNKSTVTLKDVTVAQTATGVFEKGVLAENDSTITISGGSFHAKNTTISAKSGSAITLTNNANITSDNVGLYAEGSNSTISMTEGTVTGKGNALVAENGGHITVADVTLKTNDSDKSSGVFSNGANSVIFLEKTTISNSETGLAAIDGGAVNMTGGSVAANETALFAINGGHIDLTNVSATAEVSGLQFVTHPTTKQDELNDPQKHHSNEINLTNAELHAENGTGIFIRAFTNANIKNSADLSIGTVNLTNSEIHADVLLRDGLFTKKESFWEEKDIEEKYINEISNGTFTLSADHSNLEGRANIAKDRNVRFDLKNKTTWTLKTSTKEKDADGNLLDIAQRSRSDISTLNFDNSSIIFNGPTEDHYHTLHIGSGKPDTQAVYNASGDAKIYFNIAWSDGVASADQKTDRLLIHGDVSGSTTVYIKSDSGDESSVINASDPSNIGGLSLIQVSGKAQEDSFKLVNGYTTRNRLPYKYTLTAYGPESSHGQADVAQSLFDEKNENFWDFRLHKEILETGSGSGPSVIVPVAQTASYLVMPNALFYSGLTDIAKQNALLANIRTSVLGKEEEKQTGFFLYTYGNTGTLSSERGPLKYGYGANIRYAALQAGVTFATLEGQNTTTHFGLVGTYGRLSFTPKDMNDVSKSTWDKWSLTAYGSVQHDNGFYMDTLLSYGILKGDIGNAIIGKTAKLKNAKMLSISTTVGKEFATRMEGLTFEPQAQIAYQHLMFNTIEDADNFTVDMKNPSQWLIRVGGRLTKTISTESNRPMSFYGKVNLIKTFGDNGTIHIGRNFDLDPMGPAIEGGVGINAQLSHNFSLHGDVSYQQKLQKTGISGASFSGGIRYQF
ncbi:autotransporter outer membrane beta-barrel domain-containing protein [Bartonella sp. TT121SHDZB]|uniref:autotransporter outer membrane beta-barrel domain-containing protein n=1 Tax=Bartonella sp. TT121SHDZB TaxID=3243580 RepID=UPI0035CFA333